MTQAMSGLSSQTNATQTHTAAVQAKELSQGWAGRPDFTILQIGFPDTALALRTIKTWLDDPVRSVRLHLVLVLSGPFDRQELANQHASLLVREPHLEQLSSRLIAGWPASTAGVHRVLLGMAGLTFTLAVGEISTRLSELRLSANWIEWDGAYGSSMESTSVLRTLKHVARLSDFDAVMNVHAVDSRMKEHLRTNGYEVSSEDGPSEIKVSTIKARLRWNKKVSNAVLARHQESDRRAIVIGAGIAGASVADRLAQRGWQVSVLDKSSESACGASGLWLGAMHPHFSQDDCQLSRVSRAALMLAVQRWAELLDRNDDSGWIPCGVAHPATSAEEELAMKALSTRLNLPGHVVEFLSQSELSIKAGAPMPYGGYWHRESGVVDVRQLVKTMLSHQNVCWRPESDVCRIERVDGQWNALARDGRVMAQAPVMVLANAGAAHQLVPEIEVMHPVRGQMTGVSAELLNAPKAAVVGYGYVLPARHGRVSLGASYDPGMESLEVLESDHQLNLRSLATLIPSSTALPADAPLQAFVGTRYATSDHLPQIGAVPDLSDSAWLSKAAGKRLTELPRQFGLYCAVGYGSRGLTWSVLAGEILASHLQGEPAPLEATLMDAVDPARFVRRRLRSAAGLRSNDG